MPYGVHLHMTRIREEETQAFPSEVCQKKKKKYEKTENIVEKSMDTRATVNICLKCKLLATVASSVSTHVKWSEKNTWLTIEIPFTQRWLYMWRYATINKMWKLMHSILTSVHTVRHMHWGCSTQRTFLVNFSFHINSNIINNKWFAIVRRLCHDEMVKHASLKYTTGTYPITIHSTIKWTHGIRESISISSFFLLSYTRRKYSSSISFHAFCKCSKYKYESIHTTDQTTTHTLYRILTQNTGDYNWHLLNC